MKFNDLPEKAKQIRTKVIEIAYKHGSSHVGSCLSDVEILVYLFYYEMRSEDRFILSKGHSALTLYCILNDLGYITDEELEDYPAKLGIHPEIDLKKRIYASTGSLGHGLAIGLGYALADKSRDMYVLMGDGEMGEGSVYEAMSVKLKLGVTNLIPIVDRNGFSGYEKLRRRTSLMDGNDFGEIEMAFNTIGKYPVVELRTVKGKGLERFENEMGGHYWDIKLADYDKYKKGLL